MTTTAGGRVLTEVTIAATDQVEVEEDQEVELVELGEGVQPILSPTSTRSIPTPIILVLSSQIPTLEILCRNCRARNEATYFVLN